MDTNTSLEELWELFLAAETIDEKKEILKLIEPQYPRESKL